MTIDRHKLRGAYGRLKGMQQAMSGQSSTPGTLGQDYNKVINDIGAIIGEPMSDYVLPGYAFYQGGSGLRSYCDRAELSNKLNQALSYLEYTQHVGAEVMQIGSIFNSIQDEVLKSRCADLLSAPGNFDRVINQATLVLEDRLRTKAGSSSGSVGVALVNEVVRGDPTFSPLKISDIKSEQDGYASILRGVMQAYRNPTHHQVLDHISREDALKVCAFIDSVLNLVDNAVVQQAAP
jgi:uncharacterized protein (TIGR02391 family)